MIIFCKSDIYLFCATDMALIHRQASSKAESKTKSAGQANLEPRSNCSQHITATQDNTQEKYCSVHVCVNRGLFFPLHECQCVSLSGCSLKKHPLLEDVGENMNSVCCGIWEINEEIQRQPLKWTKFTYSTFFLHKIPFLWAVVLRLDDVSGQNLFRLSGGRCL